MYNDTETREIHWIVNGKNKTSANPYDEVHMKMNGHRCAGPC